MSKQKMEQFGLMEVVFFIVKTSAIADKNLSDKVKFYVMFHFKRLVTKWNAPLIKLHPFLGLNILENIGNNVSTQLDKIQYKESVIFRHFIAEILSLCYPVYCCIYNGYGSVPVMEGFLSACAQLLWQLEGN